jgi:hypothetical protein
VGVGVPAAERRRKRRVVGRKQRIQRG